MINRRFKRVVSRVTSDLFRYDGKWCVTVDCVCDGDKKSKSIIRSTEKSEIEKISIGYTWYTNV